MDDLKPKLDEASIELASAMNAVEESNKAFFAAFKAALPTLSGLSSPPIQSLLLRWDEWNEKRRHRDRLKDRVLQSR